MTQLVFLHGPGAGGCAQAYRYQTAYFRDSLAPDLPGRFGAAPCSNVERYTEWVRGWLWARRHDTPLANRARDAGVSSLNPNPFPGGRRERRVPADAGRFRERAFYRICLADFGCILGNSGLIVRTRCAWG